MSSASVTARSGYESEQTSLGTHHHRNSCQSSKPAIWKESISYDRAGATYQAEIQREAEAF